MSCCPLLCYSELTRNANSKLITTAMSMQHLQPAALQSQLIHPASRGVAAHTAGLFRSVRGAKGGVEYEEQSSTGELTYITAGFVNIFLSGRSPSCGISNS